MIFRLQFPCLPKGGVWLVCFFRWAGTCSVASCVNCKTYWVFVKLLVTKSTRKPHWLHSVGFSFDLFVFRDLIITFFCVNARQEKKKKTLFCWSKTRSFSFSLVLHLLKKMLLLNHEKQTSQTKTPLIALSGVFLYFSLLEA